MYRSKVIVGHKKWLNNEKHLILKPDFLGFIIKTCSGKRELLHPGFFRLNMYTVARVCLLTLEP